MTSRATARQNLSDAIRRGVVSVIDALHVPQAVYGTVTAISTTTQTCTITQQGSAGTTAGVKSISSYVPTVGDTVVCWRIGTDLWIQGKIGGPLAGVELSRLDYVPPASPAYSLSSTALVQIDGTHLAMPAFTVPASGKIVWSFGCLLSSPGASVNIFIQPYDTTLGVLGNLILFSQQASPALLVRWEWIISGLTPGSRIGALQPVYEVGSGTATIYGAPSGAMIVQSVRAA